MSKRVVIDKNVMFFHIVINGVLRDVWLEYDLRKDVYVVSRPVLKDEYITAEYKTFKEAIADFLQLLD